MVVPIQVFESTLCAAEPLHPRDHGVFLKHHAVATTRTVRRALDKRAYGLDRDRTLP
jgi:hypothetical protein